MKLTKCDRLLKKGVIMFINEELDYLYRKLDYAIWQKESNNVHDTSNYKEAIKMIHYYQRKIRDFSKKRRVIKQLTLF